MPALASSPRGDELKKPANPFPSGKRDGSPEPVVDDRLAEWKEEWIVDRDSSEPWRRLCKTWRDFRAGRQWLPKDWAACTKTDRVPVTVNLTAPIINMVRGHELKTREDIVAFARELGDAHISEAATAALDYVRDTCNAQFTWSEAFADTLETGMGWVGTHVDYDIDPKGRLIDAKLDCGQMYWDYAAEQRNLLDARRLWEAKIVDLAEAREIAQKPNATAAELDAAWSGLTIPGFMSRADSSQKDYRGNKTPHSPNLKQVRLIERQWYDMEDVVLVSDPADGSIMELAQGDVSKFGVQGLVVGQRRRRVYKRAIIGADILLEEELGTDSFHFQCITGIRDSEEGLWYGMIPSMMDPQRWANSFLTHVIHLYRTMGKGGLLFETDAFVDVDRAIRDWATSNPAIELQPGTIGRQGVMEKPVGTLPPGVDRMIPMLVDLIRQCAGVNPEMLGMTSGTSMQDPSGLLEMQRQEAGMTMLADYFDNMHLFRRVHGRLHLDIIINFLMDEERLIRVVGEQGAKYVPMLLDGEAADYDLITEGVPTSPNQKERNWRLMQPLLPVMVQLQPPPEVIVEFIRHSPFPTQFADKLAEMIANKNPSPEEIQKQQQEQELMIRGIVANILKDEKQAENYAAQAELNRAKAQATGGELQLKALDGIDNAVAGMRGPQLDPNKQADLKFKEREGQASRALQEREGQASRASTERQGQAALSSKEREGAAGRFATLLQGGADRELKRSEGRETRAAAADENRANRFSQAMESGAQRSFQRQEGRETRNFQQQESRENRNFEQQQGRATRNFEGKQAAAERKSKEKQAASKPKPAAKPKAKKR